MSKTVLIILAAVLVLLLIVGISGYNGLVSRQTSVEEASANIDTVLQRRADLIPNLVSTVQGFASHETEVFAAVNAAREKLVGASTMEDKAEADAELTASLGKLIAIAEAYPELKSDKVFVGLMDELSGTENRISRARQVYNEAARDYNQKTKTFPSVILANLFGFKPVGYFEANENASAVPTVNFGS